ncbi:MAG UNVERIFIED_CONTAM: hypothetical protein LVR18_06315 [Planctomycetaceae bacterium]|jgi:hypothetical protein
MRAPLISDRELTARFGLTMLPAVVERTPAWVDAAYSGFSGGPEPEFVGAI